MKRCKKGNIDCHICLSKHGQKYCDEEFVFQYGAAIHYVTTIRWQLYGEGFFLLRKHI